MLLPNIEVSSIQYEMSKVQYKTKLLPNFTTKDMIKVLCVQLLQMATMTNPNLNPTSHL